MASRNHYRIDIDGGVGVSLTRQQRQRMKTENKKRPEKLQKVPKYMWPKVDNETRTEVWLSRYFLVQEFPAPNGIRLSVNRTSIKANGDWSDNITWEELQEIKRQVGYGDKYAIEVYPMDRDIVNVANMRHLWILPEPLSIGWRATEL